jgi:hypothetical protein
LPGTGDQQVINDIADKFLCHSIHNALSIR